MNLSYGIFLVLIVPGLSMAGPKAPTQDASRSEAVAPARSDSASGSPQGNFQLSVWAARVKKIVEREWKSAAVPDSLSHRHTNVLFTVLRDGTVRNVALPPGTTDDDFSRLALESVRKVKRVPPLPAGYPGDTLSVTFNFSGKLLN